MAVLLGVSVSTAQSRLARGRQELQERLAEEGGA
jgi:DNA-directed RNA polymerase specialized sigma24 family protein